MAVIKLFISTYSTSFEIAVSDFSRKRIKRVIDNFWDLMDLFALSAGINSSLINLLQVFLFDLCVLVVVISMLCIQ